MKFISITPENAKEHGLFCAKDIKSDGFAAKEAWLKKQQQKGLQLRILMDEKEKQLGFIEYIPIEHAARGVAGSNWLFIHCLMVYAKKDRNKGIGKALIQDALDHAKKNKMGGVATMTSKGTWISGKEIFEKNGFSIAETKDRFELMIHPLKKKTETPEFIDWEKNLSKLKGWHLIYMNQCPWHTKSVTDLLNTAHDAGIDLKIKKISSPKSSPAAYGTFALVKDGVLLEDHYISATRFKNILKKQG